MRYLILGASGQLGTAFASLIDPTEGRFVTRSDLDLVDHSRIEPFINEHRPDIVINCAAFTAVDRAEQEPDVATAINSEAVRHLAEATALHNSRFVTFSTDYVFDGSLERPYVESDIPNPLNVYGRTKLEGEHHTLATHPSALVIRTSWVISATHRNFVTTMVRLAAADGARVVDDQHGRPTIASDLAAATLNAIDRNASGILHLTNGGDTTWFDLARTVVRLAGLDPMKIRPCTTDEYPSPTRRPRNSILESERIAGLGIAPLPDHRASLPGIIEGLRRRGLLP
ncbi:MAG: dTDP-4-dehydrorhamnose reductase [Actinomycetia bacterium]|nr:dTDP-4-dehydrorhamnose reductase [Actinomycetes bacterium]